MLIQVALPNPEAVRGVLQATFDQPVALRSLKTRGKRAKEDKKAIELAIANAEAEAKFIEMQDSRSIAGGDMAEFLGLARKPSRIEAFDISHCQGTATVASRIVLVDGMPERHLYRVYKITSVQGVNDFAAMEEVISRRFADADEQDIPDIILVDGGAGQLAAALKGLQKISMTHLAGRLVALAKKKEEVYLSPSLPPLELDPDRPGMLLLRFARDESHRYAVKGHHRLRNNHLFNTQRL